MKRSTSSSVLARRRLRVRPLILALCSAGCLSAATSFAVEMPVILDGRTSPVAGTGSMTPGGTATNPTQTYTTTSPVSVWHFGSFGIGAGGSVHSEGGRMAVFRVMGDSATHIFGSLTATNRVVLINRNGIHAHGGASFGGAGTLVMSAHDIDPALAEDNYAALLADPAHIRFVSDGGHVVTDGFPYNPYGTYGTVEIDPGVNIVAGDGGSIFLVGDYVRNQGRLTAKGGSVGLVAAGNVELELGDSGFITLKSYDVKPGEDGRGIWRGAINTGEINAENGEVTLAQASFGNTGTYGDPIPSPFVVASNFGFQNTPGGAFNDGGVINAWSSGGRQGKVTLESKGRDNVAVNSGSVDVSGQDDASQGGTIRMSAAAVLVGGYGESIATLHADGVRGGGSITLDTAAGTAFNRGTLVYADSSSAISAAGVLSETATAAAKGGTVRLGTAAPVDGSVWTPTDRVLPRGAIDVQGARGGQGGTVEMAGRTVNAGRGEGAANILVGVGGLWKVTSTNVSIGTTFFEGEGGFDGTFIHPDDISGWLNQGVNVAAQAQHTGAQGSAQEEGYLDIEPGAGIARTEGNGAMQLTLASTNDLTVGAGASITSTAGALNVTLNADSDKAIPALAGGDSKGSLIIGSFDSGNVEFASTERVSPVSTEQSMPQALAVEGPAVLIATNGGNVTLTGAGAPRAVVSDSGLTNTAGVAISAAQIDAGAGTVTIQGAGGSTGSESASQNGVSIANAEISGSSVSITGESTSATGVSLTNTTITGGTGQIAVVGKSEGGDGVGQHIGVDIQDNVVFNFGSGGGKIHGLAEGGLAGSAGLRIKSLKMTTSVEGSAVPLISLVGQSQQSSGPGLEVVTGGSGLSLEARQEDQEGPGPASNADLIIGANAGTNAPEALVLGTNQDGTPILSLNTTGRVNIRPMSMEINNPAQASPLDGQAIRVGSRDAATPNGAMATNFNIDSRWLAQPTAKYVIGSSSHTGQIAVANGALNNAGAVTLQNQGTSSAGILLGSQSGVRKLNLLTSGNIRQSGSLGITTLNVIMGPNTVVTLNDPGNAFTEFYFDGATARPDVTAASQQGLGDDDIVGFDTPASTFRAFAIAASANERDDDVFIDRSFEGTDLMNELRTDVYVHGQLSRPQLCTPANTAGAASAVGETGADPLALEWVKVRRGPQLTNCAGMRADSNCAAF